MDADPNTSTLAPIPRLSLRPREAAMACGVSERTFNSWLADPEMNVPAVKLGGCVLVPVEKLTAWLHARQEGQQ